MVEYVSVIVGLGIVMFFLIELAFSLKSEEPLGTNFMTVFRLIVISLCLVVGMTILSMVIQILNLQGATSMASAIVWIYYIWWTFIGIALLFLPLYYFFIIPRQTSALLEAAEKKKKNGWMEP